MGDKIIITDEEKPTPSPEVIVVVPQDRPKVEKVVTEKTTIIDVEKD